MLFPNTPFRSTATARPVASAKRDVPDQPTASERNYSALPTSNSWVASSASLLQSCSLQVPRAQTSNKRRSGGRYLLVIVRAGGIDERSWRLWRMRSEPNKGAQLTTLPTLRDALSCHNRRGALLSLLAPVTTMSRCQRSAPPVTNSMRNLRRSFMRAIFF